MTKLRTYRDISLNPDQYDETEWRYHQATGLLERKEYANDHGTDYAWYDSGRLKSRIWARGNGGVVTNYAYDALGNPDTVTYTDGTPPVDFDYNRSGRMVAVSDVAGDHALSYQPDGKMNTETISGSGLLSGFTLSNEFGVSGQALRESFGISGNSTTAVTNSFGYLNGRMSTASQGSTTATYQLQANSDWVQSVALEKGNDIATHWSHRDPAGRITGQIARRGSQPTGAILASAGYKYDSHGRREWLTREDGTRWEFGYNDRDEVQSGKKRLPNNGAYLAGQQFSYNYDDIGNRTTAQFGGQENGGGLRTISYTLDADHDPAAVGSVNQYRKIDYSGHVSLIGYGGATTQVLPSTPALLTETDQANQSNRWWRELQLQSPAESSGLFADLSFEENGVPLADAQGELWLNPTNYEPEYDLDGNLTSDARWDYTWNGENRLIRMTTKASAQATGHPWMRLTFAYDWQGRRVQKKVEEGITGNVTKDLRYLYDGWNLIAEYKVDVQSSQLTLQISYLWGFDLSGTQQGAGGVGGLLAVTQHEASNELCYFPSYDGNGNIIAWINESGVVAQRNDYDPFGNLIAKQGDIEGLNYGFSTKYTDEETGLCYYGYRYYDPVTGRWPSRDPIGERGGTNVYGFVGNDGVERVDVLGQYTLKDAEESLKDKGVSRDVTEFTGYSGASRRIFSKTQIFDEWLILERNDNGWLERIPDCPNKICVARGNPVNCNRKKWGKLSFYQDDRFVRRYHPDADYCMRSKIYSGSAQQCCYKFSDDYKFLELIKFGKAAGTPDRVAAAGFFGSVWSWLSDTGHVGNDVSTFHLAEDLNRINDYLTVRPPSQGGGNCYGK